MKKFNIIHIPLLSFYSGELYRDVGLNWRGVCFGYLFLLLALCTIPWTYIAHKDLSDFIDTEAPPFVEQVPKITIENGEVNITEQQPYYIKNPDGNDILAIIDTTGKIQSLEDTEAYVLLTRTKFIHRQSELEYRTYNLSQIKEFALDKEQITEWLNLVKKFSIPILFPFILLGLYIFRIIQALIYAAIGLCFASLCNTKLSYPALIRLSVVAVTPCIIFRTVFVCASIELPLAGLWFFIVAMGFLFIGVKACSQSEGPTNLEDDFSSDEQLQSRDY